MSNQATRYSFHLYILIVAPSEHYNIFDGTPITITIFIAI